MLPLAGDGGRYVLYIAMNSDPKNIGWSVPHYIDASVAVKLLVPENYSEQLRDYLINNWSYHFHITEFAFYETLSVLKQKLLKKEIDMKKYHTAIAKLTGYLEEGLLNIDTEFRMDNFKVILEVGELVNKYSLDYSDALQIYTVLKGKWNVSCYECKTVFITADSELAEAARHEGLRVWNPLEEATPPEWNEPNKTLE